MSAEIVISDRESKVESKDLLSDGLKLELEYK
jgi:hypothetical protein